MINPEKSAQTINGKLVRPVVLWGTSSDTKPTENIANSSIFIEMDTSTVYTFNYDDTTWEPWGGE